MSPFSRVAIAFVAASLVGWLISPIIADLLTHRIVSSFDFGSSTQNPEDRVGFALAFGVMLAFGVYASSWTRHPRLPLITHTLFYWALSLLACAAAVKFVSSQMPRIEPRHTPLPPGQYSITNGVSEIYFGPLPMVGLIVVLVAAVSAKVFGSKLPAETSTNT